MTYDQVIDWIYNALPMFQNIGAGAYKPGLDSTLSIMEHVGNPHCGLKAIHVAGTNGKGSTSHLLASILMEAGYKVGLYTSPHLLDFRERIRVDGQMVEKEYVRDFVERNYDFFKERSFSFFEMTTAMAFSYFKDRGVDIAVIETGLGGRLDSTNVITPMLSVITNIALDHTSLLGDTRGEIAREKAGIIKRGVPVVVGEADDEVRPVFERVARENNTSLHVVKVREDWGRYECPLGGVYQRFNISTAITACEVLGERLRITSQCVCDGIKNVIKNTHLQGRWQVMQESPLVVCDTGHNVNGVSEVVKQLKDTRCDTLHIVIGMVGDKDIDGVLKLMPREAVYYFTQASVRRAMTGNELREKALGVGLCGESYDCVVDAVRAALSSARENDMVYIGGSTFVVADALECFDKYADGDIVALPVR
ncbi:MAG: bifunctional folylpolyglutamate synthase/dihydrofolate synthase [Flavobacteriales bacterium]|nr:bifunctional folylpolyglutamate synthase/dihydrofolate synthase [Flavobacteriales bacterium]